MQLIDTHTHIYDSAFAADLAAVVERAVGAGVAAMLLPACEGDTLDALEAACDAFPGRLMPMMGLQPEEIPDDPEPLLADMEQRLRRNPDRYVGVGEIGLDYYWDDSRKELQRRVFSRQLQWACALRKPVSIHCRKAHSDLLELLDEQREGLCGGVFHCFGGTADEARQLLQYPGFCLGIGGVLTFKKSGLPEVLAEAVPLDRVVLETDAPYLAPVPHRGKRNEPAYLVSVAERVAEVYGCTIDDVARQTTENACRTFRFSLPNVL